MQLETYYKCHSLHINCAKILSQQMNGSIIEQKYTVATMNCYNNLLLQ